MVESVLTGEVNSHSHASIAGTFIGLTDTPSNYPTNIGQLVRQATNSTIDFANLIGQDNLGT
jgi:hypothetical protein